MDETPQDAGRPSVEEAMSSLTGFDQIAIRKSFGLSFGQLQEIDQLQLLYALAFVMRKREGMQDGPAFQAAQALTLTEVQALFADEDLNPESAQGKGD